MHLFGIIHEQAHVFCTRATSDALHHYVLSHASRHDDAPCISKIELNSDISSQ